MFFFILLLIAGAGITYGVLNAKIIRLESELKFANKHEAQLMDALQAKRNIDLMFDAAMERIPQVKPEVTPVPEVEAVQDNHLPPADQPDSDIGVDAFLKMSDSEMLKFIKNEAPRVDMKALRARIDKLVERNAEALARVEEQRRKLR